MSCLAVTLAHNRYVHLTLSTAEEANVPFNVINNARNVRKVTAYSVVVKVNWLL